MQASKSIELMANSEVRPGSDSSCESNIEQQTCFHCLEPLPKYSNLTADIAGKSRSMCCLGCKSAAEFIALRGLERFYEHRERNGKSGFYGDVVTALDEGNDVGSSKWKFLDSPQHVADYVIVDQNGNRSLTIMIQGLYCSSCAWLIERALHGVSHSIEIQAEIDAQTFRITVCDPRLAISKILNTVSNLGYKPVVRGVGETNTADRLAREQRNTAIRRIAVAGFGMMQVMTYATALYFGGQGESGALNLSGAMDPQFERFFLLISMLVATVVVFYSGKPFFDNAFNDLRNGNLGMDVPIALAVGGAYFPSVYQVLSESNGHVYFDSAVMFVFFISLGRYVEMRARLQMTRSGYDIQRLLPSTIEVQRPQQDKVGTHSIKPTEVLTGDVLRLNKGDVVPFDAIVKSGVGQLDESLATGEALPMTREVGDSLIAGSHLLAGNLTIIASCGWAQSSIAKILQSLQAAHQSENDEVERNRLISRYFVSAILVITAVVAGVWFVIAPERVFEICLAMLIASCPCAFLLASPVGRSAAIHALRRVGVLITNNRALTIVPNISHWCFDKTGTLTMGRPTIERVIPVSTISAELSLQLLACLEQQSEHVLSRAFRSIDTKLRSTEYSEIVGQGIKGVIDGESYFAGRRNWVEQQISAESTGLNNCTAQNNSEIVLANSHEILAIVLLMDEIRSSSSKFLSLLRQGSTQHTILSGDRPQTVKTVGESLGIKDYRANLLPTQKSEFILERQQQGAVVAMVGDGINDAPVLSTADLGIAMAAGSDFAIDNADVILLNGKLQNLNTLIHVAGKAKSIAKQNMRWALAYNSLALPLAAAGGLTPWIAALGMSLSSLLVVLNALRISNFVTKKVSA